MALFLLAVAYLSVVMPFCTVNSGDPLTWASIEAQGAYIIGDGKKCSAIPNTFEMRADGAWLPASEYDLTGNFDDDCGITVTLSIPSESSGPDLQAMGQKLESEAEDLRKGEAELEAEKTKLREAETALEVEKEGHEKNMVEVKEARVKLDEDKKEVEDEEEKMRTEWENELERKKKQLKEKNDKMDERRKALESKKDQLVKDEDKYTKDNSAYEDEKDQVEKEKQVLAAKKERLTELYKNCVAVAPDLIFLIPSDLKGKKTMCTLSDATY